MKHNSSRNGGGSVVGGFLSDGVDGRRSWNLGMTQEQADGESKGSVMNIGVEYMFHHR